MKATIQKYGALTLASALASFVVHADPLSMHLIERIQVKGRQTLLSGSASTASEGLVGNVEIAQRPLLRTGELLEFVPGMVVTQHSGNGKANQYFLRGFNLDHGTDFATYVDGMPVNMRTHGHGQGYTDLNFLIPELVDTLHYQKGAYYGDSGDFSAAGTARFGLLDHTANIAQLTIGEFGYQRLLAANTATVGEGKLVTAGEVQTYEGPWQDISEDVKKVNTLARYNQALGEGQLSITAMLYKNTWHAADQIPQRAVQAELIDLFGSLDTSVGGESARYSLSARYVSDEWNISGYAIRNSLALWSNFTFFLNDPVNGDQFEQTDDRWVYGADITRHWHQQFLGKPLEHRVGAQVRVDDIAEVGLFNTQNRRRLSTVRTDSVEQVSASVFSHSSLQLSNDISAHLGIRYDHIRANVDDKIATNGGSASDGLVSVKAGVRYHINDTWQGFVNFGQGFHSNDARGTTTTSDPISGEEVTPVDFLVRTTGAEIGLRFFDFSALNASIALWYLEMDSELLYVGDAGTNEPSRPSRRYGAELAAYYWLDNRWSLDMELALTHARFSSPAIDEGDFIDGALPSVASLGMTYNAQEAWQLSLRVRHFGPRTLDSFNTQRSSSNTTVNLNYGHQWDRLSLDIGLFNLFNSRDSDIDYFYASRLTDEPLEGVEDIHTHPLEPRALRLSLSYVF